MEKKILIVDDDVEVRESLKLPLLLRGYTVLEANNGLDGLTIARREKPLVMLQDILIAKLDGFRVARMIKFDDRYKHIVMIAITQMGRQETQDEAKRVGFDYFLAKPLNPNDVVEKIDKIVASLKTTQ